MYRIFQVYFSDLTEDAQRRFLETGRMSDPSEMKWDLKEVPIALVSFETDEDEYVDHF